VTFRGWKAEALEFFEGLEVENSKPYWEQNKIAYQELVREPMEELLEELEPAWGAGRLFRPYRDIRFSRDKSPYKTNIAARVGDVGYVQLDARGLAAGSGMWEMASDQLERYRQAVVDDGTGSELEELVARARKDGLEVMSHGELKTAPKGYPKDHPRVELLRYKGLATWKQWPAGPWLGTRRAKERIVDFLERSRPIGGWLRRNVADPGSPHRPEGTRAVG
jgi:uncharacterized protein (TIGR02453 family)